MNNNTVIDYPIVTSMLDDDRYKIKTSYAFFTKQPGAIVKYRFFNRNPNMPFGYLQENIEKQIKYLSELRITSEELDFLHQERIYDSAYLKWINSFKYSPDQVKVWKEEEQLCLEIQGHGYESTLWEVKLLDIISELHSLFNSDFKVVRPIGQKNLDEDVYLINLHRLLIAEFGTRRRYSKEWQEHVVAYLSKNCPTFTGTSNMHLAMKYNLKAIGTMPHEWIMSYLALTDIRSAQVAALLDWKEVFPKDMVALTDTFGTDNFFKDFTPELAQIYPIQRLDSGDPFEEGEKIITNYKKLDLNPLDATALFSDGLCTSKCVSLKHYFEKRSNPQFAIGTAFTNNLGLKAPNIVIKAIECNGKPLVKLSNVPGKVTGDPNMAQKVIEAYQN